MDRKGTRDVRPQKRKRKFYGNRHTVECDTNFATTSAEKLRSTNDTEVLIDRQHGYCILEFFSVFTAISNMVVCRKCQGDMKFNETQTRGLGFKIAATCKCGVAYINSCPVIDKSYEINRRIVLVMRLLGLGMKGISLFCGLMDISQGLYTKTFDACLESIHITAKALYQVVTKRAVEEEINKTLATEHPMDYLTVSSDGTWKKRGFTSLFGVSAITGIFTKKVLDSVVKSSVCKNCGAWEHRSGTIEHDIWLESHGNECPADRSGNAGKMEVDAVTEMFQRSQEKYGVYYMTYVGDGDSETFKSVLNTNPYDDDIVITKKECIRHAEKRMGTRLRIVRRDAKGIDGKEEGKLTDELIKSLTMYYSLAIRKNSNSVNDMKKAIWATLYHEASSDANPQHEYCPSGSDSWCTWRQAEAKGALEKFTHRKAPLHDAVVTAIKPVYEDFTADALLERCLGAYTQNSNESLHSLIWTFAPKHMHAGTKTVEIATFLAVCIFNEGFQTVLKVMSLMGITVGPNAKAYADKRDNQRISRASSGNLTTAPHARQSHDEAEELFEEEEDMFYGPDIAE